MSNISQPPVDLERERPKQAFAPDPPEMPPMPFVPVEDEMIENVKIYIENVLRLQINSEAMGYLDDILKIFEGKAITEPTHPHENLGLKKVN